jgi:RHS repeat-associated protein
MTIHDDFSYDGYGVLLQDENNFPPNGTQKPGYTPQQLTDLLYTGERFDSDMQQYYLRARYYNPMNGRFNRVDPFAGSPQDPQSLHKYNYAHNNPVNAIDPSGKYMTFIGLVIAIAILAYLAYKGLTYGLFVAFTNARSRGKHRSFDIPRWVRMPIGSTPHDLAQPEKVIGYMGVLSLLAAAGSGPGAPIALAWTFASYDVPKTYVNNYRESSMNFSGYDLFALACEWDCINNRCYLEDCRWIQCQRDEGYPQPRAKECNDKIKRKYFKEYGYNYHIVAIRDERDIKRRLKEEPLRIYHVNDKSYW